MSPAVFALIGVAVGALLSFASSYTLERRRERRSVQAAARLVQEEFFECAMSAVVGEMRNRNEPIPETIRVAESAWNEHRAELAGFLSGPEWSDVNWAARHRREFREWLAAKTSDGSGLINDDYTATMLRNLFHWANRGYKALDGAARIPWRTRRALRRERDKERLSYRLDSVSPEP